MSILRISMDQWQAFVTVVREDGYQNASLKLNLTQPSISYSIKKIEQLLGVKLFEIQGRKSMLTSHGRELYVYAARLIQFAAEIEQKAEGKIIKIEHRIRLAVDEIFPVDILMQALSEFSTTVEHSTVTIVRGILSGPCDMLEKGEADIAITYKHPKDIIAEAFFETKSAIYASENHRLSKLGSTRTLTQSDLVLERQIIVMDTSKRNSIDIGWLNPANAWYVDDLEMKLQLVAHGLGYSWLNEEFVTSRKLNLNKLNLDVGSSRQHKLYLAYKENENMGDAHLNLIKLLKKYVSTAKR